MSTKNPFSLFPEINPETFDFAKVLSSFQLPGVDLTALLASQRKNIEAVVEANRLAATGMQSVAKRQAEILNEAVVAASARARELGTAKTPKELAAKQAEVVKEAFEKAFSNMRQLSEMVSSSANQALDVVNKRVVENFGEVKEQVTKG
ncbi:MAG: phasin family protein [Deltaproteobacteria bacterium]|nr:phasin family protein [Deltaproteobacteria bacterium]